ncbi:PAS domain-containing protein [Moraxella sp. K127]|jgi:methyl-accepting chemotaxis protein|uniref:PAS domain-containing protein n=2 Tax=Moraxella TaxID=475 RepID=A0A7T3C116_MORNO|nr:PAS domain-containing protein [Moraxella sp. K127]MDI4482608.1 PAS domain S-box protein [Moraxella lacunata]MDI4507060.1 PAS domain S-box protein [Moraxella lacunata]QPT45593.1 PAS domain-containing protein [Moraxella nonliquefaciens]QQC30797.1 PAS domain-containing protein [Moraxella nonliquefaciens]
MAKPAGDATEYNLTFFDGTTRTVYDTGVERPYPDGRLIVSRTDLNGVLTHVNDAFVEISGYTEDELIGKPQHILRHPDMPKAAYADLWKTVKEGKKWHGYVKNLCKDGSHYWVYATVVPNVRRGQTVGYTSVRRKPSRSKIEETAAQYLTMKGAE